MPLNLQDFTAWIEVDGAELPIYDVQEKDKEAACWIPSEAGKEFSVKWSSKHATLSMCGDVRIDGQACAGIAMQEGSPTRNFAVSGVTTSATTQKPFVFSKLELTDDDEYLGKAVADLGDIKLIISRATFGTYEERYTTHVPVGKVHEKAKKATGHKIGLGVDKTIPHTKQIQTTRLGVVVTFTFKYRPIDMLRANGIAPPAENKKRAASTDNAEVLDLTGDLGDSDNEDERRMKALKVRNLTSGNS
ncbi:hypothetical protein GYMLUDRAFT_69913 [Collybiopsis luxurians FD-317 M1]|nr:hypothetical protein GYMLUDRAFT_69913 [Collybiopsis luxurians FD-317 M1]